MLIISHRGNVTGPNSKFENQPFYIQDALAMNVDVEVDVWNIDNIWYLGHDNPEYPTTMNFLNNDKLWCHAKNSDALFKLKQNNVKNYFWHRNDDFTLTSSGYIWTYPNRDICSESILVINYRANISEFIGYGICTDYTSDFLK